MPTTEVLPSGKVRGITWDKVRKRKGPTKTFDGPEEAYAWACAWENRTDRTYGKHGIEVQRRGTTRTFAAFASSWTPGGSIATQATYRNAARRLAEQWPTEHVDDITPAMVEAALYQWQNAGTAVTTRTIRLTVARHIFRAAVAEGLRDDDPTLGIKGPRQRRSNAKHCVISEEQLALILEKLPVWMRAPVLLARDCGLRISEVAGIRWFRLDLLHAKVVVADMLLIDERTVRDSTKGGRVATLPLSERVIDALKLHSQVWPGGPTDRVFRYPNGLRDGGYLSQRRIREEWNAAVKAAGLRRRPRFHDLRHTRAQSLVDAGIRLDIIQGFMRHESIAMTREVYLGDVPVEDLARAMKTADALTDGTRVLTAVG